MITIKGDRAMTDTNSISIQAAVLNILRDYYRTDGTREELKELIRRKADQSGFNESYLKTVVERETGVKL
jgi:hypothetical protein